ncbi:MAG: ATP-binding cassette domain-containing protein [Burkholderiales bacterium]
MVTLENVSKKYGRRTAVAPVTLEFARGRTTVLIGPSGCGKSTLLRMIVGLVEPDTGHVLIDGKVLTPANVDLFRHQTGYVIQDGGLFPHLSAEHNVTLLARHLGMSSSAIDERVHVLAKLVSIPPDALQRYPQQLSGGQRQRIGLMRALMLDPPLILLDEPLGALDPVTRYELQDQLRSIFSDLKKTVIMVTHDMSEAAYLGDDIVMMREGRVVQRGSFDDLVRRPSEPYVESFIRAQRVPTVSAPT